MVRPSKTLFFIILVLAFGGLAMRLMPEKGISLGFYTLRYPTWDAFWENNTQKGQVAMESFYDMFGNKKENAKELSEEEKQAQLEKMRQFQFPGDQNNMLSFFEALNTKSKGKRVRILHFGDSQIEGNRITGPIHNWFQRTYGGMGPGWIPVFETIPTNAVQQQHSDNWTKYAVYGKKNATFHKRYGLLGALSRFTPETAPASNTVTDSTKLVSGIMSFSQSTTPLADKVSAWVTFSPAKRGPSTLKTYTEARLCFGNLVDTLWYRISSDDTTLDEGYWLPKTALQTAKWKIPAQTGTLRLSFEGRHSPDFYGISLESDKGVFMDNIAMRGSSGTIFNQMDLSLLRQQAGDDHVAMIVMQYGGNSVPYIKSQKQVDDYQKWFQAQIKSLKKLFPEAVVLVIGPSDMSIKVADKFETYPFLPQVRDALKKATFDQGGIFFDLYEAMGGKNSMPGWVKSDPPLASPDHIHFAPSGSALVSEWLINAFKKAGQNTQKPQK